MNYQEKVSTRAEVKALYERVAANPAIEKYRGYTETKSYGWNPLCNDCIKRDGEVWFENPAFIPPAAEQEVGQETALASEPACEEELFIEDDEEEIEEEIEEEADEEALADAEAEIEFLESEISRLRTERDEAVEALVALRDALSLVAKLANA